MLLNIIKLFINNECWMLWHSRGAEAFYRKSLLCNRNKIFKQKLYYNHVAQWDLFWFSKSHLWYMMSVFSICTFIADSKTIQYTYITLMTNPINNCLIPEHSLSIRNIYILWEIIVCIFHYEIIITFLIVIIIIMILLFLPCRLIHDFTSFTSQKKKQKR